MREIEKKELDEREARLKQKEKDFDEREIKLKIEVSKLETRKKTNKV